MNIPKDLLPGDVLLCAGIEAVRLATNSQFGHVAVYVGGNQVITSLTKSGVGMYPIEEGAQNIVAVRRPISPFNLENALATFKAEYEGKPYGWWDCIDDVFNIRLNENSQGWNCSHTSSQFLQDGGVVLFADDMNKAEITPRDLSIPVGTIPIPLA